MKTVEMYQKPQAEFLDMKSNHALAAKCWGNHGKGVVYEYRCAEHPEHAGLVVRFRIKEGGCQFNSESVELLIPVPEELKTEFWDLGSSQPVKTPPFYPDGNPS